MWHQRRDEPLLPDDQNRVYRVPYANSPTSAYRPLTSDVVGTGNPVTITWSSVAGKHYQVETKNNLAGGSYTTVSGVVTATAASTSFADTGANATKGFYRVRVVP